MVAAEKAPTLSVGQIETLLDLARRPDTDGLVPSDEGWTPTWNLNAAAAEGWRWKAAAVAGDFTFSTDGQSFSRSDKIRACLDMARMYSGRVAGSVPLNVPTGEWDSDTAVNTNV